MILAEKIMELRKKNGWSQEELAEKIHVSRQSVSKWESSASIPDLSKILLLSQVFGVSTDYLLRDDIEETQKAEIFVEETVEKAAGGETIYKISLEESKEYIKDRRCAAKRIGVGVVLCILSPVILIYLASMAEYGKIGISEDVAGGIGIAALILSSGTLHKYFLRFLVVFKIIFFFLNNSIIYFTSLHFPRISLSAPLRILLRQAI